MTSLLVLLGLLSVATLLSRRGYFAFVTHIVTTPILLALGALLSPRALAFLTPSTLDALLPALRVGLAWLAVLVGLRAGSRAEPAGMDGAGRKDALVVGGAAVSGFVICTAAAAFGVVLAETTGLGIERLPHDGVLLLGAAVLLGGTLSPSNHGLASDALAHHPRTKSAARLLLLARREEIVAGVAVLLAVWLLPLPVGVAGSVTPVAAALLAAALGMVLAAAQLLAGGLGPEDAATRHIALMGIVTLTAGLAARANMPEAAVAFSMGLLLSRTRQGELLLEKLAVTERPVRLVVVTLIGANLGLTFAAVTLGLILALARLVMKGLVCVAFSGRKVTVAEFSAAAGSSSSALVFVASAALALPEPLLESGLLASAAIAVATTDIATLLGRGWVRMQRGPLDEEDEAGADADERRAEPA